MWIDDAYKADTEVGHGEGPERRVLPILEKHPEMKDVFRLGNHVVWISPSGTALVIDQNDGKEKLDDEEIDGPVRRRSNRIAKAIRVDSPEAHPGTGWASRLGERPGLSRPCFEDDRDKPGRSPGTNSPEPPR